MLPLQVHQGSKTDKQAAAGMRASSLVPRFETALTLATSMRAQYTRDTDRPGKKRVASRTPPDGKWTVHSSCTDLIR